MSVVVLMVPLLVASSVSAQLQPVPPTRQALLDLEGVYADFNDASGAVSLIDSNPSEYANRGYAGKTGHDWRAVYAANRNKLMRGLDSLAASDLSAEDRRAIEVMRLAMAESSATPDSLAPVGDCKSAQQEDLQLRPLREALYACFAELANSLQFEQRKVTRVAAFDLLTRLQEPQRRKLLFMAFQPLWRALNGHDEPSSPYRRMIRMAAAEAARTGSAVDAAAKTVGVPSSEVERWLERILDKWREVTGPERVEPWDYRFQNGGAARQLAERIPRGALLPLSERYYHDLGLDLARSGVMYDLEPRQGKAPLAYTDYVRRGRMIDGSWRPTIVRVSASYEGGGIGPLDELVHENGHVVHMLALRTRPAFMDLGDPIFFEAFADVPAWNVYEPEWQQKYLHKSLPEAASLRALYSEVMLDVAWALFDLRMLGRPGADPNRVWTGITSRYLHIKPHPELAWWAVRVQLVHKPGYMVNYGLGAVITADIRQRIASQLGPFRTGNPQWYDWLCDHLLASGEETETRELLRRFLGTEVAPQALLEQLQRIGEHRP